jgi:hypothetical protein
MSDDDVNQLTPDDGALDEVVDARLRAALLDDVEVTDRARDLAVRTVIDHLDDESPSTLVTELSSRRRNRMSSWMQVAAAVAVVAVGAGVVLQLQTSGDDLMEMSVKQATVERSEGDFSLAYEEDSADEASDSAAGAMPEAAEESIVAEESMASDEEMAVEEAATADLAVGAADLPAVRVEDLPTLVADLITQERSPIPINNVCAIDDGELLDEVVVDGEIVSVIRDLANGTYLVVNQTTCDVLADIELDGQ